MKLDGLRVLSDEKIENRHSTALKILGEIGIKVKLPEATELLKKAGADAEGSLIRIPPKFISGALDKKPAQVTLFNQHGKGIRLGEYNHFKNPCRRSTH